MPSAKPYGLYWRSHPLFIVATVAIGLFTDLFLYGIIVPVLPFILQDRVGLPPEQIQNNVSGLLAAYAGASVLFSPPAGIIADRISTRQAPFLSGLIALSLATLGLCLGRSMPILVIARIFQGISGAVVWTIGLALVMDTVGAENLGKTIGSIFSFISIGELAAPVVGGILYQAFGYLGVFGVGFAVLAVDIIMRLSIIEKKAALKYKVDETAYDGDTENEDAADGEDAPLLRPEDGEEWKIRGDQSKFVRHYPILVCLKNSRVMTALLVAFVQAFLLATFDATLPVEAKELYDFSSLKAGLIFIPLQVPYLLLGPVAGWAVDKFGPKPAATLGFIWLFPSFILLRLPTAGGGDQQGQQIAIFSAILSLCGVGLAIIGSPSLVESSEVVGKYHKANPGFFGENGPYGQLYSVNSMIFSLGLTLGPLTGNLREKIGYGNMNLAVAFLCLLTAALSFKFIGGQIRWAKP